MKFKNFFLICLVLVVLTMGMASASQDLDEDVSQDLSDFTISNQSDVDDDDGENDEDFTEVNIEIPDFVEIGCEDVIEIELPQDAKGNVYINVDNESWSTFKVDGDENNLETVLLDDLSCGLHLVNVTFISSNSIGWLLPLPLVFK